VNSRRLILNVQSTAEVLRCIRPTDIVAIAQCIAACLNIDSVIAVGPSRAVPTVDNDAPFPLSVWAYDSTLVVHFSEPLDPVSAETVGNYFGAVGITYKSAHLRADGRTVDVDVSGMNLSSPFILLMQGIKDLATPANTMSLKTIRVTMPLKFPVKIDVGGSGGNGYLADSTWTVSKQFGYVGGEVFRVSSSTPIANTTEAAVYQTSVHGVAGYKVRVPNSKYTVRVMMAEDKFQTVGKRVFSAKAEGQEVFANLDLFQQSGQFNAATVTASGVVVEDNMLDLWCGASFDSTLVISLPARTTSVGPAAPWPVECTTVLWVLPGRS
jgi:hypothetical protein